MTRDEAIYALEIDIHNAEVSGHQTEQYKVAIEALKQEPILDKIRAEIEPARKMYLEMNDIDWLNGCDYVLQIIDKYKAEVET